MTEKFKTNVIDITSILKKRKMIKKIDLDIEEFEEVVLSKLRSEERLLLKYAINYNDDEAYLKLLKLVMRRSKIVRE